MKAAEIPLDARDPSRQTLETKCVVSEPVRAPVDLDYSNRQGFDECFIGIDVRLPEVAAAGRRIDSGRATNETASILCYAHFSIAMSPSRKLAYYVAVNIDGARSIDLGPRGDDVWIFDERIPEEQQIGNWLYDDNDFDRGHLVRRLDPVLGGFPRRGPARGKPIPSTSPTARRSIGASIGGGSSGKGSRVTFSTT
jgi:endonuclease G, mitochondrial